MFNLKNRKARIALSSVCNFNCIYCDGPRSRRPDRPGSMEDFRHTPLDKGNIDTKTYFQILKSLHSAGFCGVVFTGGEPLLNPDWDKIADEAKRIGFANIHLTTNAMLLRSYLRKKKHFPKSITMLGLSLDTIDPTEFKRITGGMGDLNELMLGLKEVKADRPDITVKVNKVLLRSNIDSITDFVRFCEESGSVDEVNLLNLILKEPNVQANREFFEKEFVSPDDVKDHLLRELSSEFKFEYDGKYDYSVKLPSGMRITLKDTNITMRTEECETCPIYCQEGFYTVRVATDGTITKCIDYKGVLPYIDAVKEICNGTLDKSLKAMVDSMECSKLERTLEKFGKKYNLKNLEK